MHLTVLAEPTCPNAPVLTDRLTAILHGRTDISMSHQVISSEDEAIRWDMHGSPTLLIDGLDPFAEPGQHPSLSCRLYRDENGRASGAQSISQLRHAIEHAPAATVQPRDPAWLDVLGRAGRGRIAPADRGLRAVHQAVLRSFVHTGAAPGPSSLAKQALPFDVSQVLAELADGDFLFIDPAGHIIAAYPFSTLPTRHRVRISGEAAVFAMCAIDALGISAMTGHPVVIESADPSTGQRITVNVDQASSTWNPVTAVVYVGRTGGDHTGPSASVCCGYMNFFATQAAASVWAAAHPEITGGILSQAHALQVGISIFGPLLS